MGTEPSVEPKRVLIVDDESELTATMKTLLDEQGCNCDTAADGLEALETFFKHSDFDLILTDLKMPRMNGQKFIKKIRETNREIPIIVITAHGNKKEAVECLQYGVTDFIDKPVSYERISEVVQKISPPKPNSTSPHPHLLNLAHLGEMASAIVHDISNPLSVISLHAQKLERSWAKLGLEERESVKKISSCIARVNSIVKSVARMMVGGDDDPELFEIKDAIDASLLMLESKIEKTGTHIVKQISPNIKILGEQIRVEQVMANLVANAIDVLESQKNKVITISVEKLEEDNYAKIRVSDNGPGVAKEIRNKIFDKFFTTKVNRNGTGLGLYLTRKILQNLGGDIYYDFGPPSTFVVAIPLRPFT